MPDPWDPPGFPTQGDLDQDTTYCGVGHVLSQWEAVEIQFARIYSILAGKPYELEPIKEYGEPGIFRERATRLERRFESYRVRRSAQALEGDFRVLFRRTLGWSGRRNDVAHGIVEQAQKLARYRNLYEREGKIRYVLIPSYYMHRKRDASYRPTYCYSSQELHDFAAQIFELSTGLEEFQAAHFPDAGD